MAKMGNFPGSPVVKTPRFTAGGAGSISGWGMEIPHAACCGQKKKKAKMVNFMLDNFTPPQKNNTK